LLSEGRVKRLFAGGSIPVIIGSAAVPIGGGRGGGAAGIPCALRRNPASTIFCAPVKQRAVYRSVEFVVELPRSTPALAVLPLFLFLILFGTGESTKVAVATFGAVLVTPLNAAHGVMNARPARACSPRASWARPVRAS